MDLTGVWRFIAFYNQLEIINDVEYYKFDISTLFSLVQGVNKIKVYAYLNKEAQLKIIKL